MAPNNKIDYENLVQELASSLEFKNYNGKFYIKTSKNWVYFHPSNKQKYPNAYDDILFHLMDVIGTSNLEEEESWDRSWDKSDIKFLNKIIKKLFEHVSQTVPNTAHDDVAEQLPLPSNLPQDLLNMIIDFKPNDTNMDFINTILKKIMLPKDEIIKQLIMFLPNIEADPAIIEIYYKYVVMFATKNLMNLIRDQICDEFHEKKSYPANVSHTYVPFSKDEDKYIKKYIYLNKTSFGSLDKLTMSINSSMEQLLFSEIKQFREIDVFDEYGAFRQKFLNRAPYANYSEIEIFSTIFRNGYDCEFYKKDWKTEIPELLSNTTNILTKHDIYIIKQYPIWVKSQLENISTEILKNMTNFSKIEKYDKTCKSMVERVEKLIKLQNKYQYHMLQKYKNECRNELKTIEKFTK